MPELVLVLAVEPVQAELVQAELALAVQTLAVPVVPVRFCLLPCIRRGMPRL